MGHPLITPRPVGATGLAISRIGFGGAPIGDLRRTPTHADAMAVLDAAWDAGMRYYDTAPFYGSGLSERRMGDFLRTRPRDSYVLSTKVGRLLSPDHAWSVERFGRTDAMPFRPVFDFTRDGVLKSFEHSLQRLGLERIDILYLHDIGRFSQKDNHEKALDEALAGGGLKAMQELRASGAVRAIGVGVNEWPIIDQLLDHADLDIVLLANRYTLLDQEVVERLFPRITRDKVALVSAAPLSSGILLTGAIPGAIFDYQPAPEAILDRTRRIEAACARHGVPLIRAALQFPLGHPAVTALLPGFSKAHEIAENLAHLATPVPPALWAELKAEGLIREDAPTP